MLTSQTPRLLAESGACGVGSYMLEASVRPTHHYPTTTPTSLCVSRQETRTFLVDGVQHCLGRMQALSRQPWLLHLRYQPNSVRAPSNKSTQQQHLVACWDASGLAGVHTGSTPSSLDATGSGVLSAVSHCSASSALCVCSIHR